MPLRIVSLGDSIVWGQGLSEADKFDVLVRDALADANPGITLWRLAHSGAVIGVNPVEGSPADGEVPMCGGPQGRDKRLRHSSPFDGNLSTGRYFHSKLDASGETEAGSAGEQPAK